jgi:NAD(P)-dependent dehydrogenase (short-subunit alcohol dehydrogenase family)
LELSGRTVLVTEETGGIGLGIAEAFHRSKSKVIVCGPENDADMIFHGDGEKLMSASRGESESRLLTPSW